MCRGVRGEGGWDAAGHSCCPAHTLILANLGRRQARQFLQDIEASDTRIIQVRARDEARGRDLLYRYTRSLMREFSKEPCTAKGVRSPSTSWITLFSSYSAVFLDCILVGKLLSY